MPELTPNPFPGSQHRTASLGRRNLDHDILRLRELNPDAAPLPEAAPGVPVTAAGGSVAGRAATALQVANGYFNQRVENRQFYSPAPNLACASFVSTVLVRSGFFAGPIPDAAAAPAPGAEFTRSASALEGLLRKKGAIPVVQRAPVGAPGILNSLVPGDIILWTDGTSYHHSGFYDGDGRVISISSGNGRVDSYRLADAGYRFFTAYRLP